MVAMPVMYAIGWLVTESIGIDVARQREAIAPQQPEGPRFRKPRAFAGSGSGSGLCS
jgi:hypothetical protein